MAGSLTTFLYETDVESTVTPGEFLFDIIQIDESNGLAMGGTRATAAAISTVELIPGGTYRKIEPRYVNVTGQTAGGRLVKRRLVAPTKTSALWRDGGQVTLAVSTGRLTANTADVIFDITSAIGEKRYFLATADNDTGLDDTTQP